MSHSKPPLEYEDQVAFMEYMDLQYPNIMVTGNLGGIRLPIGLAVKAKRMGRNKDFPDIEIHASRGNYCGLYIELKRVGTKLYKKNGDFINDHYKSQNDILIRLREEGYKAEFAIGFEEAKSIVDKYLRN